MKAAGKKMKLKVERDRKEKKPILIAVIAFMSVRLVFFVLSY